MATQTNKKKRPSTNQNKNTTANRSRASSSKTSSRQRSVEDARISAIKHEIALILLFAACIVVFLCNFDFMGEFGHVVKGVMFGLFGMISVVIPICIFVAAAFRISNKGDRVATRKLVAAWVIVWIIGMMLHMFSVDNSEIEGDLFANLYSISSTSFRGGGVICGLPAYGLVNLLTTIGSILVLIVLLIICLVIITERSFIGGVRKGTKKVVDKTREESEKIIENRQRNKEYREQERQAKQEEYYEIETPTDSERNIRKPARTDDAHSGKKQPSKLKSDGFRIHKANEPISLEAQNMHEVVLNEDVFMKPKEMQMKEALSAVMSPDPAAFEADVSPLAPVSVEQQGVPDSISSVYEQPDEYIEQPKPFVPTAPVKPVRPIIPSSGSASGSVNTHSFGMTEEYKDADQKKQEARDREIAAANAKKREALAAQGGSRPVSMYKLPTVELLKKGTSSGSVKTQELEETKIKLEEVLRTFGVNIKPITSYSQGPAVTRFEIEPEMGVKVSRIASLADDIKLNLAAADIRIEAPIPGKAAVGIEVPNKVASAVSLRELFESGEYKSFDSKLSFAVGKDLTGQTVVFDIAKMPHVLIAGSTGSGKSVCINTLIMSILFKARPDEVQLIMIDPKVVELKVYNGIPHLICPVVTEPKKASATLQWAVSEMTERYKKFADNNVRDLKGYNKILESSGDPNVRKLPHIVIIVDELADLMMVAGKEVEESIVRLAQLARAAGIHLVIATQRPSVNVITGLIKANMPSRVAFAVTSGIDSRTILDMNGAEKLLGKGDMLFYPQGYTKPSRVQGAFVSDEEVGKVVDFILNQHIENQADQEAADKITSGAISTDVSSAGSSGSEEGASDELVHEAGRFIIEKQKASIGMLQRQFRIGFNRAARIMDELADLGVVGEEEGTKPRKILMTLEEFEGRQG